MTVITAVLDQREHRACVGADDIASVRGWRFGSAKVVTRGAALVGGAGVPAIFRHVVQDSPPLPASAKAADVERWCRDLAAAVAEAARAGGHGMVDDGVWLMPCSLIVATSVGLWLLTEDGDVVPVQAGEDGRFAVAADGAGRDLALGAMWAAVFTEAQWLDDLRASETMARLGVEAALALSAGCHGHAVVEVIGG